MVSHRTALMLIHMLSGRAAVYEFAKNHPATSQRVRVRIKIEAEISRPARQGFVEGVIRGTTYHDQAIVLTAHMQEGKPSANDDRSGCANLLEIARALQAMIADGRLARPKRDIRFWWTNEIDTEYEYFSENPDDRHNIIADINQDMAGAKQSDGNRVQQVDRSPYSRWSYLNNVVESIVNSIRLGNNAYIPSFENQNPAPYSRPILAHLGTREPYHAEVVPYFDSTDHQVFNESVIGIPGVTFTNWPDEMIHSTDDDLQQIDPTQMQRNEVAVASTALYLANIGDEDIPTLSAIMYGGALQRTSKDFQTGLERMTTASPSELDQAYRDAVMLVDTAFARETHGLESIRMFADSKRSPLLNGLLQSVRTIWVQDRKQIDEWCRLLNRNQLPSATSADELELGSEVPTNNSSLTEYLRLKLGVERGNNLMLWEAMNYVDGKRSLLDIYRLVRGESLSAGEWYYGVVTPQQIKDLFISASRDKVVVLTKAER